PLLLLHFVLPEQFIPALDFAIGLSLGFHFVALSREFRPIQTDLTEQTMFFSAVFTIFANTMLVMIIIGVLTRDSALLLEYLQTAAGQAGTYYTEIFDWLRTQDFAAML
ncbi:MAG: hypothetical protein KDE20_27890, partial [Caldilineaceae bacterium]|nr:hypothetical protein [Caldilineaceae bacterium]